MTDKLDTMALFRGHFVCWRILGFLPPKSLRPLYWIYSLLVHVLVTVCYPLHLALGLATSTTMYEVMQNLAINLTVSVCSMKTIAIWWRFDEVHVMFDIIRRQDERLRSHEERNYLKKFVYPDVRRIFMLLYVLCVFIDVSGEASLLVSGFLGNWNLMYKAYFPFDPFATTGNYIVAHIYQYIGVSYVILQNVVNDTFGATHLALLGGHVRMLGLRVAKIGHDPKRTPEENNQELLECIHDHKDLLEYRRVLEDVISVYMFFQIILCGVSMCIIMVYLVIFVQNDPITIAYYMSHLLGVVSELLPSCYYGTILEDEFQNVAYALFSCNWPDQNVTFRKHLRIFIENASRRIYVTAWLFRINNNAFLFACKNAYTLFALIMQLR